LASEEIKPAKKLLSKPMPPSPEECCGSGCVPCIYDSYYEALEQWQEQQKTNKEKNPELKGSN